MLHGSWRDGAEVLKLGLRGGPGPPAADPPRLWKAKSEVAVRAAHCKEAFPFSIRLCGPFTHDFVLLHLSMGHLEVLKKSLKVLQPHLRHLPFPPKAFSS